MQLFEILGAKGMVVHSISPEATLAEVVARLVQQNCGSLVVTSGERMVGIITERDILRASAEHPGPLSARLVRQHMTTNVITASPEDEVSQMMGVMTEHRIRHVPVLAEGRLMGLVSIGDLVKAQHDELCFENHYLKHYLQS